MAGTTDIFDLGRLHLRSGEGRRLDLEVMLDRLKLGGQDYEIDGRRVPVRLDVAHTTSGWSLRLRFDVKLAGPCMRCLEPASRVISIDAREVDQPGGGDDLSSPYVDGDDLDVHGWARDALALDLPATIVCRDDCAGLCPTCGQNLNEHPHEHEQSTDPRWAKLSELKLK
ncbi:MAG TPA: DUF177 domain-containing protein [Thermoleophilaceae bacterium]|jgi:uncharacterized protein|nr:DUF177 domain-containing protein [Thermoleophilaceae bacterium]